MHSLWTEPQSLWILSPSAPRLQTPFPQSAAVEVRKMRILSDHEPWASRLKGVFIRFAGRGGGFAWASGVLACFG